MRRDVVTGCFGYYQEFKSTNIIASFKNLVPQVGPQPPATGIFCGSSHRGSGHTDFENADYEPWNTDNTGHGNMRQRTVQNARLGGIGKGDTFHQAAR